MKMNPKSPTHVSTDFVPEDYKEDLTVGKKYKVYEHISRSAIILSDKGEELNVKFIKGGFFSQYCSLLGEGRLWTPHYEE